MERPNRYTAACIRAVRTALQTFVGAVGTTTLIEQVEWQAVVSTTALATLVSLAMGISTALPETDEYKDTPR